MREITRLSLVLAAGALVAPALASGVGDITNYVDQPRLFNDFSGSSLIYASNYSASNGSLYIHEQDYGAGGWANRHAAWFGNGPNKVDFNFGDGWDMGLTLQVNQATDVGNVEAGFQADLFGFGLFGVLTWNGEIAAFGSILPFHSFGSGLYTVGDVLGLRMIHRPGDAEMGAIPSTMEYMYNNYSTGSGWVSSGEINFTTLEGGIPSFFDFFLGAGAQINQPNSTTGLVDISFSKISIPAPGALGLLGLAGVAALRRRR